MQHGSLATKSRLEGPDVWQFRWSERPQRETHISEEGDWNDRGVFQRGRRPKCGRQPDYEVNWANLRSTSVTMTVAQLCSHFEQRELARSNT
jgi:hypothetical protein